MAEPTNSQSVFGDHNVFSQKGDVHIVYQLSAAEGEDRRNLLILLNKVKQFWIKGVLEQSIYHEVLIELGKESRPEMVAQPLERVHELPDAAYLLPTEKSNGEIFEETGRLLLIVGEPGSGKTVTLLELASELITKAESNPTQPIPVVFNLSTWAGQPIFDWLVNELSDKYYVSKSLGRTWIKGQRLTPLLDGLDEVAPEKRATCVTAINEYLKEHGLPGLLVCSRLQEYLALPKYIKLYGAICLQPLNHSQIENYFHKAGPKLASLHTVLQDDPVLQELAETPLMLSVMSLAYQDLPLETLSREDTNTPEERRKNVFNTYIKRMLSRKGKANQAFTNNQVIKWLSWLAKNMNKQSKTMFLMEELQPSWLPTLWQKISFVFGSWFFFGMFSAILYAILYSIILIIFSGPLTAEFLYAQLLNLKITIVVVGLLLIIFFSSFIGIFAALIFVTIQLFCQKNPKDIKTVENLGWSWKGIYRGVFRKVVLFLCFIIIIVAGLPSWFDQAIQSELKNMPPEVFAILSVYIIIVSLILISGCITKKNIDYKYFPNQGIIYTLKISLSGLVILGFMSNALLWVILHLFPQILVGGPDILETGNFLIMITILSFYFFRGGGVIKHYILRLILALKAYTPLNYTRFLDYATKLIFLRKVGGGYIFIHRMFMEHLAAMSEERTVT